MNIALWIVQGLLALAFLMGGAMKAMRSKEDIKPKVGNWVDDFSGGQIKTIGLLEVLGAIGVVLPWALNIMPSLTVYAAAGLALTMVGAMIVHLRRKEYKSLGPNIVLFALSLFVVIGRSGLL